MPDAREVYLHHAQEYDALVRCEDALGWRAPLERALAELQRVLRPGGVSVVIETLGTGHEAPFTPPLQLGRYYTWLEEELGFARTWVRTDYAFPSVAEGERLVRFFFGEERARRFAERERGAAGVHGDLVAPQAGLALGFGAAERGV